MIFKFTIARFYTLETAIVSGIESENQVIQIFKILRDDPDRVFDFIERNRCHYLGKCDSYISFFNEPVVDNCCVFYPNGMYNNKLKNWPIENTWFFKNCFWKGGKIIK